MKNRILWALVGLNAMLLVPLALRAMHPAPAMAAVGRARSDYLIIPANVPGGSSEVMYVVDTSNGLLGAINYNESNQNLDAMPTIDLLKLLEVQLPSPAGRRGIPGRGY